ncbi:MAG: 8-amino-7-oxononanoate synthase [Nitrospiria bacterium]
MLRLNKTLEGLEQRRLLRGLHTVDSEQASSIVLESKKVLLFSSNNYLGLANHPSLKKAATAAIQKWGVGAGASRLISGNTNLYHLLEEKLARLKSTPSSLIFSSGYTANVGTINALVQKNDLILADRLNHASLIDGCRLSDGTFRIYRHKDTKQLEKRLSARKPGQNAWIVTDGIFSMDGDIVPLSEILQLAEKYDATVYLDDAHATGVLGPHGGGTADHFHLSSSRLIQMGTFSKALGGLGGFIAGSKELTHFLINKARSFIYTTALPPSVLAGALAALDLIDREPHLRTQLWENRHYFHASVQALGFDTFTSETPIVPLRIGSNEKAIAFSEALLENHIYVPAIRSPTVPKGSERLRITLMATHTKEEIDRLLDQLEKHGKALRVL